MWPFRSSEQKAVDALYGRSAVSPILCDGPAGERACIDALRCLQGHKLEYRRLGSMMGGCPDPKRHQEEGGQMPLPMCPVDKYEVTCVGGEFSCELFFDMYHRQPGKFRAPRGLKKA